MLLPLLGTCALVGPFQGAEWEPVRALLAKDRSCRDPRCCGNLLVLFLFVIWQVRQCWYHATRPRPRTKKVIKTPLQTRVEPSMRCDPCFELSPEFLLGPGMLRGLDAHVHPRKKRWERQRSLQESWSESLLSGQPSGQRPSWEVLSPAESVFCSSFSSSSMLSQDSSWEAWPVPWCLHDDQISRPLPPALDRSPRVEQLFVHSQAGPVSAGPAVRVWPHSPSGTSDPFPDLPSVQRLQFCSRELLPVPLAQPLGMSPRVLWGHPPESWTTAGRSQTQSREDRRQAPGWVNPEESRKERPQAIRASGKQLPVDFGMRDEAEFKDLEVGSQRPLLSPTDGQSRTPGWEQMGVANRVNTQELGERDQREAGTQAYREENQEHLTCKIDAETQTPKWGNPDEGRNEEAVEIQALEKKKKKVKGEGEGESQRRGCGKQDQTGGEEGEKSQVAGWAEQDQRRVDTSIEIQAEERRNKSKEQAGGETGRPLPASERKDLEEVKKEDDKETQALGWGHQDCVGGETLTEIPITGWEKQDQSRCERPGEIQPRGGETQKQARYEVQVGRGNRGRPRGKDAGETELSGGKTVKEIRQEDWVVMEVLWWGDQRPVINEIVREFEMPRWGWRDQHGGEHRAGNQVPEKRSQGNDGSKDYIPALAPEAENQGRLRDEVHVETHPPRNQEQLESETRMDSQASRQRNPSRVKDADSGEVWELGGPFCSQRSRTDTLEWKNHKHIRSQHGATIQVSTAKSGGQVTREGESDCIEREQEEQVGGEDGAEMKAPGKREAGGKEDTQIWGPGEGNQCQLRWDADGKTHLSERTNQEQMGGENGTEIGASQKRECGGEEGGETERPEAENQGQSYRETEERLSPGRRNQEQTEGKNAAENQTSEGPIEREVGSERNIQKLGDGNQRLLHSKVYGNPCSSEWQDQEQTGGESDAEIQIQEEQSHSDDDTETQASEGDEHEQLSEMDAESELQEQGNQNEDGDEDDDAVEMQDGVSQRMCRTEAAGGSGGSKDQSRGMDAVRVSLQDDCSGSEGSLAFSDSEHEVVEEDQAMASAPSPEMKPFPSQEEVIPPASGEEEPLASQSTAPARKDRVEVQAGAGKQVLPNAPRRQHRDGEVDPGETSGLTEKSEIPQFLGPPSAGPSGSWDQEPQAATALGLPTALTVLPKWSVLKKSQRQRLESLMRQKMAHLQWGLPQRILTSHSLSDFLEARSLPLTGMRSPGAESRELQGQQEAQRPMPGPEKPRRPPPPVRKASSLPSPLRALEKCPSHRPESKGLPIRPAKPRRSRPPGGAREPQADQAGAPPETRSCSAPERARELCSRCRKLAERAPSRARTSQARPRQVSWGAECLLQKPSKPPTPAKRGSLEPVEGRGTGQPPSSYFPGPASFKGSLCSTAAGLSRSLRNKIAWGAHLPKPQQRSASSLSLGDPDPGSSLPQGGGSPAGAASTETHPSLKRDLQPPGGCCARATLPKTESPWGPGVTENPNGVPQNPSAPRKFGLMKHFRCFLHQHGFRK